MGEGSHPKIQKELRQLMPPGVYDRLYEQWLPALRKLKGFREPKEHRVKLAPLYGPTAAIEFACSECKASLAPEYYDALTIAWSKGKSFIGPVHLLHHACLSSYKQEHRGLQSMPLPELFDLNKHSYRDWLIYYIADPLVDFFKPKSPPVRLKFGKDVWVCTPNEFVLVESEPKKHLAVPKRKPIKTLQPLEKQESPLKPRKEPKPQKPGRPGVVYLIQGDGWSEVKIGHGINALARLKLFQTGNPKRLRILREIKAQDSGKLERLLHDRYDAYRGEGEWFDLPEEILDALLKETFHDF